jgi:hypothetical protein
VASELEDELRIAIKNGFLHLNLSLNWKGDKWQVGYRTTEVVTPTLAEDPDPVEAIKKALRAGTRDSKSVLSARKMKPTRELDDLA